MMKPMLRKTLGITLVVIMALFYCPYLGADDECFSLDFNWKKTADDIKTALGEPEKSLVVTDFPKASQRAWVPDEITTLTYPKSIYGTKWQVAYRFCDGTLDKVIYSIAEPSLNNQEAAINTFETIEKALACLFKEPGQIRDHGEDERLIILSRTWQNETTFTVLNGIKDIPREISIEFMNKDSKANRVAIDFYKESID